MSTLVYLAAYAGTLICLALITMKVCAYLKKPLHIRWEIYPVAHEKERASYGGSYYEDVGWWKSKQHPSFIAGLIALLIELLFLHATYKNNKSLWVRTYPLHLGFYCIIGSMFLTIFAVILGWIGITGWLATFTLKLVDLFSILGFIAIACGAAALLQRRYTDEGLRKYTMREHFLNLYLFLGFGLLGIITWLSVFSYAGQYSLFVYSFFTFSFTPLPGFLFGLLMIYGAVLIAYIPATHMAHFFMKYFLYHDIRWGDQPTRDNPKTQEKMSQNLTMKVDWAAEHIGSNGEKTWGEVATTNPTKPKE